MNRSKVTKIILVSLSVFITGVAIYLLIFVGVLGDKGKMVGGTLGFFILLAFISTASKSKQQMTNELKYMSKYHNNQRPKV